MSKNFSQHAGTIYKGIHQCVTLSGASGRRTTTADLAVIENAACVVDSDRKIAWLGPEQELPDSYESKHSIDDRGGVVWLPALVECHTHLVYGGQRHLDFDSRCNGDSYQQVAARGGGILSTVQATRQADEQELLTLGYKRLLSLRSRGVGPVEIKTGYGLDLETESKMLRVISRLKTAWNFPIKTTFLPAHAIPREFKDNSDGYVAQICRDWIPSAALNHHIDYVDVFVEKGYFSLEQAKAIAEVASDNGLGVKLHCDQFTASAACQYAAGIGAVSCDHLEQISDSGIEALARSSTVAVVLPLASLFTPTALAPARKLVDAGAMVAISTDLNPGTSPSANLLAAMTIACTQMKLTIPEAIAGVTINAAKALGLDSEYGSLAVGRRFAVAEFDEVDYRAIVYRFGDLSADVLV